MSTSERCFNWRRTLRISLSTPSLRLLDDTTRFPKSPIIVPRFAGDPSPIRSSRSPRERFALDNSRALYEALFEPAFSAGAHSLLPVDWARLPVREAKGARPGDRRRQGLTIPVRGPTNGVWALFGVRSDESDREWSDRRHEIMKDLVHVAHYVHQRAYDLHAKDAPIDLNAITRREIEALEWSAEGKSPAEIAVTMRISLETVKAHLDSARFKLQALNRVHTVTKAIWAGLIR